MGLAMAFAMIFGLLVGNLTLKPLIGRIRPYDLEGYEAIREVLGEEPSHVTRAPGGNFYGETVSILEPYVDAEIGWDVDTEDWRLPGADAIYERLMSVQPGQVILCHDGGGDRSQTVEAVSRAVPELVAQGYTFVTIDELLKY
jgi:peptidoglycan/xylan/chitin deacetylase (PgdA/CDA1 family)